MVLGYQDNKKNRIGLSYAINGIKYALKTEINMRLHFVITLGVVVFGFIFNVSVMEWLFLLLTIGFVLTAEIFNTAVEHMLDYLAPEWHPTVGVIKDLTAGAVLVSSLMAFLVGLIIFLPRLAKLLVG